MPTTNKHFVGNLPQLQLSAILLSTVTTGGTFGTTGTVTGWPDGTSTRSFVVGVGTYGQTGYEEILCSLRGAGVFTVEQRGYDNTSVVQHASGDPVTLVVDAGTIDAHEVYIFQNTRRDVLANRGSAATYIDTTFYATDVRVLYRSDGTNWQPIGMASGVYTTAQRDALVAAEVYAGRIIENSTTGRLEVYTGVTNSWQPLRPADVVTTAGDLLVATAAGLLARLAIGATSQVARVSGGTLGYADLVLWVGHTWTLSSPGIPSGATNFINPKRIRVPSGMTAKAIRADSAIRAGTSVAWDLKKASTVAGVTAGTNVTGFTSQSAVPAGATVAPTAVTLTDGDYLAPVISAVTGSPDNFTVDLLIAYTFAG